MSSDLAAAVPKLPILQGATNYKEWWRAVLGATCLGGFAATYEDGKNVASTNTGLTEDVVAQCEMKACGLISQTISAHIATELEVPPTFTPASSTTAKNVETAAEQVVWLKSKYKKKDSMSIILKWQKLITARLVDDGSLGAQLDVFWDLRSWCSLNGIKINDYVFAGTILTQLPETYGHIPDTLLAINKVEDLTPEMVHSKILETEIHRKANTSSSANALCTTNKKSNNTKKKGPATPCFICSQEDHWTKKCPHKKKGNANASSSKSAPGNGKPLDKGGKPSLNVVETDSNEDELFFYDQSATTAEDWLIDSSATDHMTPYRSDFEDYTRLVDSLGARSSVPTQYIANTLQEDGQCTGTSPSKFMLIPFKMFPVRVPAVY